MHGLIHRTNEIILLAGGKKTQCIKSMGKFALKDLISNQDLTLLWTSWVGDTSARDAGLLQKLGSSWGRREDVQIREKGRAVTQTKREHRAFLGIALEVKGIPSCCVRCWFWHKIFPKISFSSSYTPSATSGAAGPDHTLPVNTPSLTSSQLHTHAAASQEVHGSSAAPNNADGICILRSHRLQMGWVTRPLPPQLLQKNSDRI